MMNWVLNILGVPFLNNKKRNDEAEELRRVKLGVMVMKEKQQAEDVIRVMEKSSRIRDEMQ